MKIIFSRVLDFLTGREYREAAEHHRNRVILANFTENRIISAEYGPFKDDLDSPLRIDPPDSGKAANEIQYGKRHELAQAILCVSDTMDHREVRADTEQQVGESPDLGDSAVNTVLYIVPTHHSTMGTRDSLDRRRYGVLISGRTNQKRLGRATEKALKLLEGVGRSLGMYKNREVAYSVALPGSPD